MSGGRKVREWVQSVVAVLALVVSVATLCYTWTQTRESNRLAREANLIAKGAVRAYAQLDAHCQDNGSVTLDHAGQLEAWDFSVIVLNSGDVPLEGLSVHLSAFPLWDDPLEYPLAGGSALEPMTADVDFDQQLVPGGVARLDLTVAIVEYLREASPPLSSDSYAIWVRCVFVPRRLGDELPVRAPGATESDTCSWTVVFSPELLRSDDTNAFLEEHRSVGVHILPPRAPES